MKKNNQINKFLKKIQSKPYIIAEIGVNHECSIKTAKKMIQLAKKGGADAVKFQTYKAELLASKKSPAYWDTKKEKTKNQFELFKKYDSFEVKDYQNLYKFSKKEKIDFLSTPFDEKAVDFLDPLVPYFKIASADITNYPLLKKIAQKKKITFLSTGASNLILEASKVVVSPLATKKSNVAFDPVPIILVPPTLLYMLPPENNGACPRTFTMVIIPAAESEPSLISITVIVASLTPSWPPKSLPNIKI